MYRNRRQKCYVQQHHSFLTRQSKGLKSENPSLPVSFSVLTDDDPSQPPSLSPPRKGWQSKNLARLDRYGRSVSPYGSNGGDPSDRKQGNNLHYNAGDLSSESLLNDSALSGEPGIIERADDNARLLNHLAYLRSNQCEYEVSNFSNSGSHVENEKVLRSTEEQTPAVMPVKAGKMMAKTVKKLSGIICYADGLQLHTRKIFWINRILFCSFWYCCKDLSSIGW